MPKLETTYSVYRSLLDTHREDLVVMSSFTNPEPSDLCSSRLAITVWGLRGSPFPFLKAESKWEQGPIPQSRINEEHKYWILHPSLEEAQEEVAANA